MDLSIWILLWIKHLEDIIQLSLKKTKDTIIFLFLFFYTFAHKLSGRIYYMGKGKLAKFAEMEPLEMFSNILILQLKMSPSTCKGNGEHVIS